MLKPLGLPAKLSRRLADAFQFAPLADLMPVDRSEFSRRSAVAQRFDQLSAHDRDLVMRSESAASQGETERGTLPGSQQEQKGAGAQ